MLKSMKEDGTLNTPEGQQRLTEGAMQVLGKGWVGKQDDVRQAVANSVLMTTGEVDLPGYLKALKDAGLTIGEIAQVFEGRHVARNEPTFQFYDKLMEMYDQLKGVDGGVIDAVTQGRKESEAGKTDTLIGAWQNLVGAMEDTGVITLFKDALTSLANTLRGMPVGAVQAFTGALVGLGALSLSLTAFGGAIRVVRSALGILGLAGGAASTLGKIGGGAALGGLLGRGATLFGGKALARLLPGLGWALLVGGALMGAYEAYSNGGGTGDILTHAAGGALGIPMDGAPQAGASKPSALFEGAPEGAGAAGTMEICMRRAGSRLRNGGCGGHCVSGGSCVEAGL